MSNIIIGADVVPYGKTEELFIDGNIEKVLGKELLGTWQSAKYRLFNLECPITNSEKEITKCGPHMKCTAETINGIKKLDPTCILLSNNHILDYSEKGLNDTIKILDRNGINWIGVGENVSKVRKTFAINDKNKKIVFYNCCEHEFSVATEESAGANPYDELNLFDEIKELKRKNDYIIIAYHGGKEYYRYPSPLLQKRCRKMIDSGANLVLCQHSHCIGCKEDYNNGTIVYGQGNFVFVRRNNEFWNTSLLVNIDIDNGFKVDFIPIKRCEDGTRIANKEDSEKIMKDFLTRTEEIKNPGFIEKSYQSFSKERLDSYIIMLNRHNLKLRIIHKFLPRLFKKIRFDYISILNAIECEAHNELFIEGLKQTTRERKK